ncbi:hypothetical protein [Aliarcobacter cryaerophilus]|uniref:GIY-YIG domain-containing protein n=3 Tax=unclassified Arcobacter TaxID=2593671 RepID=A0AA96I5F5_9BACT|nr:hypothetical protein RJG51_07560 [Arcobacter sp. AZ-2023]WNL18107.1 hypothetical protein RJG53_05720 [Arcobacter sp. AZ-2023]WNL20242.1 hypothetical protein RJG56_05570 [Arcobacter sp. AZ-2023]WNL25519.1 hypothetical protein RJG57_10780 [Arcobacter sp. AZ-2023]WPD09055.1 hypothetical protein QUR77_07510 [Arcobacter sp. DSM 115954]
MQEKIFHSYMKSSIFFTLEKLRDINYQLLKEHNIVKSSNIYFVTKVKKMRFDVSSINFGFNYNIKGKLKYGNRIKKFEYSIPNLLFSLDIELQNTFGNWKKYVKFLYSYNKKDYYPIFYKFKKEHILSEKTNSDGKYLVIDSGFAKRAIEGHDSNEIFFYADNIFGLLEPFEILGELIYIGRSQDVIKRLSKHEKFRNFSLELNDDEELLFHFLEFEDEKIEKELFTKKNFSFIIRDFVDEIEKENRIKIIEAILINYFKPTINIKEKKINLIKSQKIKKYLELNGFTNINIEIDGDGEFMKFGNQYIKHKNRHSIEYKFSQ